MNARVSLLETNSFISISASVTSRTSWWTWQTASELRRTWVIDAMLVFGGMWLLQKVVYQRHPQDAEFGCVRAGLRYCGALSTWQSRCPLEVGSGEGRRSPSPVCGFGAMPPENFSKINVKIVYFRHFCKLKCSLLQWRQGMIRIKIYNWNNFNHWICRNTESTPVYVVNRPRPTQFVYIEHLSKAEVHFLVLRCLNLYSLKCIII